MKVKDINTFYFTMINKFQEQLNRIESLLKEQKTKPLSLNEAAKYLGLTKSYMYKITSMKKIKHFKPNNKMLYFSKADLDEYIFRNPVEIQNNE